VQAVIQSGKEELNPVFFEDSSDDSTDLPNNNNSSGEETEMNPFFLHQI
jgi:hypothetical protein